jgi:hypothetical protein
MAVVLLDFVRKALRVAKQALGTRAGKPDSGGLPRETHIVAHCLRKEERYPSELREAYSDHADESTTGSENEADPYP